MNINDKIYFAIESAIYDATEGTIYSVIALATKTETRNATIWEFYMVYGDATYWTTWDAASDFTYEL